jgi:hypothetical protein
MFLHVFSWSRAINCVNKLVEFNFQLFLFPIRFWELCYIFTEKIDSQCFDFATWNITNKKIYFTLDDLIFDTTKKSRATRQCGESSFFGTRIKHNCFLVSLCLESCANHFFFSPKNIIFLRENWENEWWKKRTREWSCV